MAWTRSIAGVFVIGWTAAAGSPSQAQEEAQAQAVWERVITQADYESAYPAAAMENAVSGVAKLDCRITADGALDCVVADEEPASWGFGEAALTLAGILVAGPEMTDGSPSADEELQLEFMFSTSAE